MLSAVLTAALAIVACNATTVSDKSFDARVKAYLIAHPEVIEEALQKLQAKMAADDAADQAKASARLPQLRAAIERDPRDFVANPRGAITVTEFYDYRCPHCANVAPKVLALIRANPDIRFVFKEMPIFGATSEHAALAALAVKKAGGDYLAVYRAFMAARPLDVATIDQIAQRLGANPADLADYPAGKAQIADVTVLFKKLDLGGTPSFIVGDEIIPGEDMDALNAAIAKARRAAGAPPARAA